MINKIEKILMTTGILFCLTGTATAKDLTVDSVEEAEDLMTMIRENEKLAPVLLPCFETEMRKENADRYNVYHKCICGNNNTVAIETIRKLNAIYDKHPNWAAYSRIKIQDGIRSNGIDIGEFKKVSKAIKDCL